MSKKNSSNDTLNLLLGVVLAVAGLWLTSYSHEPGNWQSDGYSVSGGAICIIGGIFLGMWLARRHNNV